MSLEQAAALLGIAIPVIGGLDLLIRWALNSHSRALKERIKQLEQSAEELQGRVRPDDWVSPCAAKLIGDLQVKVIEESHRAETAETNARHVEESAQAKIRHTSLLKESVEADLAQTAMRLAEEQKAHGETRSELASAASHLDLANKTIAAYEKGHKARQAIIKKTLELEGQIWTQDTLAGTPPFIALPDRRTPIVSILNLKGGVGKTTLAAYLAWAMAKRGYRLLLVDLDLQGSLSSLFLTETDLKRRDDEKRMLRHFFAYAAKEKHPAISDFVETTNRLGSPADLIATSDRLAYEELNLTFQWLLRIGNTAKQWNGRRDVRMLLRKALHRKGLRKRYDMVLLDCPPLINLSCINALAASDFVLVPVTPSRKSLERVPPLLKRLRQIQGHVNPDLAILGLIANRTQWRESLTAVERDLWNSLPQACLDVFNAGIYRFETFMPSRTLIRDAESDFPPKDDSDILSRVSRLAQEVESCLPLFCRPETITGKPKQPGLFETRENSQ